MIIIAGLILKIVTDNNNNNTDNTTNNKNNGNQITMKMITMIMTIIKTKISK